MSWIRPGLPTNADTSISNVDLRVCRESVRGGRREGDWEGERTDRERKRGSSVKKL